MRRFCKQRAQRGFGWEKIVKPWTSSSTIERYKFAEGEILNKTKFANSIPATVEPIDWAYWNSAIAAPGVVEELKKEYDSHVFDDVDINTDIANAKETEKQIFDLKIESKLANLELKACDEVISKAVKFKTDMLGFTDKDWITKIPGLEGELEEEWEDEMYLPNEDEEKAAQVDYKALTNDVLEGRLDTDPVPAPERVGDLTLTEIEEAKAKGVWTIATWMQPKEERQRLYAERAKQQEETKAELLKSKA